MNKKVKKQTDEFVLGNEQIVQLIESNLRKKHPDIIENIDFKRHCKKTICVQVTDNDIATLQKTVSVNGNRFSISQDIFVGNIDSICCLATNGQFTFAITIAHSFPKINRNGWFPHSPYKTNVGYVIYKNNSVDLAVIELTEKINAIPHFNGNTINFTPNSNPNQFIIGHNRIKGNFQNVSGFGKVQDCIKYSFDGVSTNYHDSGSFVCLNGKLAGMHLGKDAHLFGCALPFRYIDKLLISQNLKII